MSSSTDKDVEGGKGRFILCATQALNVYQISQ